MPSLATKRSRLRGYPRYLSPVIGHPIDVGCGALRRRRGSFVPKGVVSAGASRRLLSRKQHSRPDRSLARKAAQARSSTFSILPRRQ